MATRQREKAINRKENKDTRPKAIVKYVRMSSSKVKLVLDLIRGKSVAEAYAILMHTPKAASAVVTKLIKSAVANAENNMSLSPEGLIVAEIFASEGPTLKRFRPRAQGRASRIRKRTSHITVILDEVS
jgi:large subunit ribosomal protein L22